MAPSPDQDARDLAYNRDRILALSDGVLSIAITLLGLELVPQIGGEVRGGELVQQLGALAPVFVVYFLSFVVIGRFWDAHRSFFRHIYQADSRLAWHNLAILVWITLIPATTALLGSHGQEPVAITLYAVNLLLATASLWMLWRYAASAGHLRLEAEPARTHAYIDRYVAICFLGYTSAIPAAFLSPSVALAVVFLTAALARLIARRSLGPGPIP
jgi:uncharacterized membrane protein